MSESGGNPGGASPYDGEGLRPAIEAFVLWKQHIIASKARRMLSPSDRVFFDPEDILPALRCRLDDLARNGNLRVRTDAQLWAFIRVMVSHMCLDWLRARRN